MTEKDLKNECYTPSKYIESVRQVLGEIDLDPFSCRIANKIVKAKRYHCKKNSCYDNLMWDVKTVFMNPPYSNNEYAPAITFFLSQLSLWEFEAIVLTNNNTETVATQELMETATAVCFPDERINFYRPIVNAKKSNNRHAQMFCYFGDNPEAFADEFCQYGVILMK